MPANISVIFCVIKEFLSRHTVILGLLNILWPIGIFLWIAYINRFPEGYVYVSGDFAQPINIENIFKNLFYTWGNGISAPGEGGFFSWFAAIPYYLTFYLLPHRLGLSETTTLSYVLFLFLALSYFSFLAALKLIFGDKLTLFTRTFALLYPINLTTLYFFTYTWGFSHQVFLYITLPLLAAIFYRYISLPSLNKLLAFLLLLFLSVSGFTNAAFFATLCFFFLLFLIGQILLKTAVLTKKLVAALLILGLFSFLVIVGWLGPTYLALRGQLSSLTDGMFNLNIWLSTQSADVLSILIGLPGYKGFFPFSHNYWPLYFLAFLPILAVLFLLVLARSEPLNPRKRLSLLLIAISIIFMVLIKKGQEPFGDTTLMAFSVIPFLSIFRSYEKLALFMPFMTFVGVYGLLPEKWLVSKRAILLSFATLFAAAPFFVGGIQTKYSITLGDDPTKDYTNSKYSGLVKIPSDYYEVAQIVNADLQDSKIQDLPYSVINTNAWVNYTKWKLIGFPITQNLLAKPSIGQNASQFNLAGWYPTLELNRLHLKPDWYVRMLALFNVSHIVYHKGVDDRFIFSSLPKIKELEKENYIQNVYEESFASLYKINEYYQLPRFYIPKETYYVNNGLNALPYILDVLDISVPANYLFKGTGRPSLATAKVTPVMVVRETAPLKSLTDDFWEQSWLWPPSSDSKDPVDLKLRAVIQVAADMQAGDSYSNVLLQASLSSAINSLKSAVDVNQNELVEKVIKHLLMVNAYFGNSAKTHDFFLPLVKDFDSWVISRENKDCLYSCYHVNVPETGDYEILLENPEKSISQAKLYLGGVDFRSAVSKEGGYLSLGNSVFTKDQPANLDVDLDYTFPSVLDNSGWVNDSIQDVDGFSRKLVGLEPSQKYNFFIKYKGDLANILVLVVENRKGSVFQYISTDKKDGLHGFFFSSDGAVNTGKIFIYSRNGEYVDPKAVSELSVEKAVSPKIILKKATTYVDIGRLPEIKLKKINPTKYRALVSGAADPYSLVFSESFHKQWKVYLSPYSYKTAEKRWQNINNGVIDSIIEVFHRKEIAKDTHYVANGYSNFWLIQPKDVGKADAYELIVEYQPQLLFYTGTVLALVVLAGLTVMMFLKHIRQGRKTSV